MTLPVDWTAATLLDALANVQMYSSAGRRAVHKPLLLLLVIADIAKGGKGTFEIHVSSRFSGLSSAVSSLIESAHARLKNLPVRVSSRPAYDFLEWHNSQLFVR